MPSTRCTETSETLSRITELTSLPLGHTMDYVLRQGESLTTPGSYNVNTGAAPPVDQSIDISIASVTRSR
jgi:hypothetical protein